MQVSNKMTFSDPNFDAIEKQLPLGGWLYHTLSPGDISVNCVTNPASFKEALVQLIATRQETW